MMRAQLEEVLELQQRYSSKNTPEMARRGVLIRNEIRESLERIAPQLRAQMGPFGHDLRFQGRDSTGPKSEIPWVRFYSQERSPNAREGWYCVFLFAGDGSGFYVSLIHGSTRWINGCYEPRSNEELLQHVTWARQLLKKTIEGVPGLLHEITLRFKHSKVADAYERGTAIAKWFSKDSLPTNENLDLDLELFARMLATIYEQNDLERAPDSSERIVENHLATVRTPKTSHKNSKMQGFGLPAELKRIVEQHAMGIARAYLESSGFHSICDTHATQPYDFTAVKDNQVFIVEVKGSTGEANIILLTENEVNAHKASYPNNILLTVHSIDIRNINGAPSAHGGQVAIANPWIIEDNRLKALTFSYRRS